MPKAESPYCCPERTCDPIYVCGYEGTENAGASWECFGRMADVTVFEYAGERHRNDLNRCVYTPLKGVIRFQENAQDWALWVYATETALCELTDRQDMK